MADKSTVVYDSLGALRLKLGKDLGLIDEEVFNFLWVTDWPLFEYDEELGRYFAAHHPFTSPIEADKEKLLTDPMNVRANAYDLVLNGYELGGGSIRIHQTELQNQMFQALGFTEEEAREQFGFLLDALEYGAPPHGGVALGLDRIIMLLAGRSNLRDTILFPKTASASDLMTEAPSEVSGDQLQELSIALAKRNDNKKNKKITRFLKEGCSCQGDVRSSGFDGTSNRSLRKPLSTGNASASSEENHFLRGSSPVACPVGVGFLPLPSMKKYVSFVILQRD